MVRDQIRRHAESQESIVLYEWVGLLKIRIKTKKNRFSVEFGPKSRIPRERQWQIRVGGAANSTECFGKFSMFQDCILKKLLHLIFLLKNA